jgi:hypothetical protein
MAEDKMLFHGGVMEKVKALLGEDDREKQTKILAPLKTVAGVRPLRRYPRWVRSWL